MKTKVDKKARASLVKSRHKARIKAKRPAHKKFLLHPATIFLLLCVGLLVFGQAIATYADVSGSYSVHAKIPADPLSQPALIVHPKNGDTLAESPMTLSGSCPDKSYVKIYRGDTFAGMALCTADGSFTLQVGLLEGANILQAHVFNLTDDEGPLSSPISVNYIPKKPVINIPAKAGQAVSPPLILSGDYQYLVYKVGETATWQITVTGGTAPYAFNVKWGDDSEANYVEAKASPLTLQHTYTKAGSYSVRLRGTDLAGNESFLQLLAVINSQDKPKVAATGTVSGNGTPPTESLLHKWAWLIVPSYGVVSLMALSYWLGEKQEYLRLLHASRRIPHHHA